MGADQFKMFPIPPLLPSCSPPTLLLLLPLLVTSTTLGCTKWDSCKEPEHYCYQVMPTKDYQKGIGISFRREHFLQTYDLYNSLKLSFTCRVPASPLENTCKSSLLLVSFISRNMS